MVQESPSIPPKCQIGYKTLKSQMWLYHLQILNIYARHHHNLHHQPVATTTAEHRHPLAQIAEMVALKMEVQRQQAIHGDYKVPYTLILNTDQ